MNHPTIGLALLGAVGASVTFAFWWLPGSGDLASRRSRMEAASSTGLRHQASISATGLIYASFLDTGHHCHWHQENRLNSPAWWLAEYYRGLPERRPSDAQIDQLEALLATIELQLSAADTAIEAELTPAVIDKMVRIDFEAICSKTAEDHGSDQVPPRTRREDWAYTSLPHGYRASIGGSLVRRRDFAEIRLGERPSLDAALDAKATLHHDAPIRIQRLIESFE